MKSASWKDTAELIGIGAIVVSLVFVALQLKQSQEIAIAELRQARQAASVELNGFISSHSSIWVRGNAGEELDGSDQAVYQRLIESLHWSYWTTWSRNIQFELDTPTRLTTADFAGLLHRNSGARAAWQDYIENREFVRKLVVPEYGENRFIAAVQADLEMLDQN